MKLHFMHRVEETPDEKYTIYAYHISGHFVKTYLTIF